MDSIVKVRIIMDSLPEENISQRPEADPYNLAKTEHYTGRRVN